jgi:hypothetical protein
VVLKCRKCNLIIAPEGPIITICCGGPSKFEKCEITWRQYVPETKGGFQLERRGVNGEAAPTLPLPLHRRKRAHGGATPQSLLRSRLD